MPPDFEKEFIDFAATLFQRFGLDSLSARHVGIIFLEPKEISMEELAKQTGYSLASVSNKLRFLESAQMVRRVKKPGTKKAFYFTEKDVYAIMKRKLKAVYDLYMTPAKTTLPVMISKYKSNKMSSEEKQKMEIVQSYYKQLLEVEKIFDKMKKDLEKV